VGAFIELKCSWYRLNGAQAWAPIWHFGDPTRLTVKCGAVASAVASVLANNRLFGAISPAETTSWKNQTQGKVLEASHQGVALDFREWSLSFYVKRGGV
jgi:hypothetical protein